MPEEHDESDGLAVASDSLDDAAGVAMADADDAATTFSVLDAAAGVGVGSSCGQNAPSDAKLANGHFDLSAYLCSAPLATEVDGGVSMGRPVNLRETRVRTSRNDGRFVKHSLIRKRRLSADWKRRDTKGDINKWSEI